ncbi:MAG: hypothetical protein NZL93_06280 [Chthoniobacterales bacterium]|nr:hypothetical protein [Chthoniobacterales bacterium]
MQTREVKWGGGGEERRWLLEFPDWAESDTVGRLPLPFRLWPVCDKLLLGYWVDEALHERLSRVGIIARDWLNLVRRWLDEGNFWLRSIEVLTRCETREGWEEKKVCVLPGMGEVELPRNGGELLRHWFRLQREAVERKKNSSIHLDVEVKEGVWIGPGAIIARGVKLEGPSWIGAYAWIGKATKLGPEAYVGPRAFVDEDVEVRSSYLCAVTYVGKHTTLEGIVSGFAACYGSGNQGSVCVGFFEGRDRRDSNFGTCSSNDGWAGC